MQRNKEDLYLEPTKELAKNTKVSISLSGWPASTVCSVGFVSIAVVAITASIKWK